MNRFIEFAVTYTAHTLLNGIVLGDYLRALRDRKDKTFNPLAILIYIGIGIFLMFFGVEITIMSYLWDYGKPLIGHIDGYFEISFWWRYRLGDGFRNLHPDYIDHIKNVYMASITELSKQVVGEKSAKRTAYLITLVLKRNNVNIDEIKPEAKVYESDKDAPKERSQSNA